jgi:hypothetical protein
MDRQDWVEATWMQAQKSLNLETGESIDWGEDPVEALRNYLKQQVLYLLNHDFQALIQALYRMDIREDRVREILEMAPTDEIAQRLAEEILCSEKQKVLTRRQYREDHT